MMAKAIMAVVILSTGSVKKLVLTTADQMPCPVASKYAVMKEEPLAVIPPKRYTAIGVETMAAVRAITKPVKATRRDQASSGGSPRTTTKATGGGDSNASKKSD